MDAAPDTSSVILASAAVLLRQRTFEDISYLDLADASEVSERTIYRRFPTRSHLLEALARWIEAEHFPLAEFHDADGFREAARMRFRAYDAEPAFAFVAARGGALSPTADEPAAPITQAIVAMLDATAPTLNRRDARRTAATVRYFASPMFWARMRTGFDMSADEISAAFDSAVRGFLPAATNANRAA
ncbi:AcrR family transcriptional regulator [Microbacterium terrae]|uniref:Division inhibitor protein n=1 Tax=Microbacterium terrae TaxID=69369 RepID=A0A0M2HG99_9MICO|nr:TetR/AcrR family transcriptional regulator [Microbacterium terrae]KJL43319.1 division inhibitor protein [Microbacterium terrae]MBP1078476.1 AcrR family transcriptional regulator [Microbacterium terrae]GLJ97877.1 transcriptional regulator [Microbacterium terrae]